MLDRCRAPYSLFCGSAEPTGFLLVAVSKPAFTEVLPPPSPRTAGLQLPPKRRQVIRLPKPGPSEWPKLAKGRRQHADDSEGSASDGGEDEDEGEGAEGEGGGEGGGKPMSAAHRTGLAKCSSIIDWLMTALGVRSGGRGGGGAKRGQGAASGRDVLNLGKVNAHGEGRAEGLYRIRWQLLLAMLPWLWYAPDSPGPPTLCSVPCMMLQGEEDDEGGGGGEPACDAPKLLVFAHHKTVMNRLAAALEGAAGYAPVGYVRIDGSTDPEDRCLQAGEAPGVRCTLRAFACTSPHRLQKYPACRCFIHAPPAAGARRCGAFAATPLYAWRCCR